MQAHIASLLHDALRALDLDIAAERIAVERTRDASHGDFASNIALASAKQAGCKPRDLAERLVAALPASEHVAKVEIAGPGFINFTIAKDAAVAVVRDVLEQGERFGCAEPGSGETVMVEFVSANPNGPLHVGHGRGAALGDSLANILAAAGHTVAREYYVNDAGRQMDILAASVWCRYLQQAGVAAPFPAGGYQGDYVRDVATSLQAEHGEALVRDAAAVNEGLPDDAPQGGDKDAFVDALIARMRGLLGSDGYAAVHAAGLDSQLADIRD
ncbi:arginine--tRNA ligase, partial [bacterium]|nr:arginine--tRNA ligase [bacterium]